MAEMSEDSKQPTTAGAAAPAFVGRQEVQRAVVDAIARPDPAVVLIEGEAGIGKTRLLNEALAACGDRVVLVAACPPLREPFPLGPVVDGLRRLRPRGGPLGMSPLGGALRPLFPEWADALPPSLETLDDPRETRHRLLRALTELIERLGVDVLVVEDAHWADAATLEWLLALTTGEPTSAEPSRSIVVTYRPLDVPRGSLLLRLTSRAALGKLRIELEPLEVDQVRELVGSMLGTDAVSEQFAEFLHDRTDGIPLALEETVRLMRDRHDIIRQAGSWTRRVLDELDVPPTVRDSVLERLDRLDPDSRAILYAAAIVAEPADEAMLSTVAELDPRTGRRGVAGSLAAGLLRESDGGRLVFRHALDAKAVAEAIPVSEQWRMHGQAAACLEALDSQPVVRLARHTRGSNDIEAWCRYAEASADLALEAGDDRTAVRAFLDLLVAVEHPPGRRARWARKLGQAALGGHAALGDIEGDVVVALRTVVQEGDIARADRGEIRCLLGRVLHSRSGGRAAYEEIEAAIADLEDRPELACSAMMTLAMPLIPDWPATRHLEWLDRASELLPLITSPAARQRYAMSRATTLLLLGVETGWQAAAELPRTAANPLQRGTVVRGLLNVAQEALVWGRYEEARCRLDAATELMVATDYQRHMSSARICKAYLAWYTGAWHGLDDALSDLVEESRPANRMEARQLLGLLELTRGKRSVGERHLREATDYYARLGVAEPIAGLAPAALCQLYLSNGSAEAAIRESAPVLDMIMRKDVWLWATDVAQPHVDALIALDRLPEAENVVQRFAEGLDGRDAPAPVTALMVCRAAVAEARGEYERAASDYADAATAWAGLPRPYDEMLARGRQGCCLLSSGDRDAGLLVLTDVQHRLQRLGATWDADRVAHILRQHGIDVKRTWRRGRRGYGNQLSPRELQVVELVARGLTNKQIAESLFISPKTVTQHLTASMRKLDVPSRTALAMVATDSGLLSSDG